MKVLSPLSAPALTIGKFAGVVSRVANTVRRSGAKGGGGSALPGLIVEKLDPRLLNRMLKKLPYGVLVVSGTNGKTTTTHMIAKLLEAQGLRVFTNSTGSNFKRGVISAIVKRSTIFGNLQADIAVLELDEAHGVYFANDVKPRYTVLLNVMRDQLDRYGELDTTAKMLEKIANSTTQTVILNREDPLINAVGDKITYKKVVYFGFDPKLKPLFLNDDELKSEHSQPQTEQDNAKPDTNGELSALSLLYSYESDYDERNRLIEKPDTVILTEIHENGASFSVNGHKVSRTMDISGIHNLFNITAAISAVRSVMQNNLNGEIMFESVSEIEPAFGRGEVITVNEKQISLVLVKNPGGFRIALLSNEPDSADVMIAVNDDYADGRDVSWYWDVDFTGFMQKEISITGHRSYDMQLRLHYDDVKVKKVTLDIDAALDEFIKTSDSDELRIYCSYTAMLEMRAKLSKITDIKKVGV